MNTLDNTPPKPGDDNFWDHHRAKLPTPPATPNK
jgi:hypothetical protein